MGGKGGGCVLAGAGERGTPACRPPLGARVVSEPRAAAEARQRARIAMQGLPAPPLSLEEILLLDLVSAPKSPILLQHEEEGVVGMARIRHVRQHHILAFCLLVLQCYAQLGVRRIGDGGWRVVGGGSGR